jgi:flagellar protein FliO/FliZ
MRLLAAILAAGCLAAAPLAAQTAPTPAPGTVLHPGTGALPDAFPAATPGAGGTSFGSAVVIVLCGLAGAALWWRLRRNSATAGVRGDRKLAIAETRPLGNRQYLVVADYEGKKFLLGVVPGRIDLLAPLGGNEAAAPPPRP